MPQETNFNVSPYFDDFDVNKDFYRVLFKPGYPVQARELTTLQSILQNQIEKFGGNFFKEGQIVIPGSLVYDNPLYAVEIDPTYNGLPISLYFNNLKGAKIKGLSSGVTAEIIELISSSESVRGNNTLYLKYIESGGEDLSIKRFQDGETLIALSTIKYVDNDKFSVQINQGVCNTISVNSISEGSAVTITEGVCFVRGIFANVSKQTLILDQYDTEPSYKIGFDVVERVVTSDEDDSLYDNARNFSNFTAPGADRLEIKLILSKKELDSNENDSFVEIMRVVDGVPLFPDNNTDQVKSINSAKAAAAQAISETSGDFFVKPFSINVRDSLNDFLLNNGVFFSDQSTSSGNTPGEDKIVYQIGPGKAYIEGSIVETSSARLLDASKPRSSDTCTKEVIPYNAGSLYVLNNTIGSPSIGLATDTVVSLMDSRLGENKYVAAGTTIGVARVYDYIPESEYEDDLSRMYLRLFDAQTYTKLQFAKSLPVDPSSYFEGLKSSASGFAVDSSPSADITSITFDSVGIGTVDYGGSGETGSTPILVQITGLNGAPHNLQDGDRVFITRTGDQDIDYQNVGSFSVVVDDPTPGIGITFEIQVTNTTGATKSDIFQLGNFTKTTEVPVVNSVGHPFSVGDEVFIKDTTNQSFNKNFVVENVGINTFSLKDTSANTFGIRYYDGPISAAGGKALKGLETVRLYEVNGQFLTNERFSINGDSQGRLITDVTEYDLSDVKSIYSQTGISTFTGDIVLERRSSIAPPGTILQVTPDRNGIGTVFSNGSTRITSNLKVGDIVSWEDYTEINQQFAPKYNKVVSVNPNGKSFEVAGITTVPSFAIGGLYQNDSNLNNEATNIVKLSSSVYGSPEDETLLTKFNNIVLSSLDLENNVIYQRRFFSNAQVVDNTITIEISPTEEDLTFASFDEDRYVITYPDGQKETIRFDRFNISNNGKTATFVDLQRSGISVFADVIATIKNVKPNSKVKDFNTASVLTIERSSLTSSGTGDGTLNDGLTYSKLYGTRIQDRTISLNVPDVIRVIGIFESSTTSDASLPSLQLTNGTNENFVVGEYIRGTTTKAVAVVVKKVSTDIIEFVYLNAKTFIVNETITGLESLSTANINFISFGDKNITQNYSFDNGQRSSFYDYSRIIREKNVDPPKRKLKIVYQNYTVKPTDLGEFYTVNSYPSENFKHDIPSFNDIRLSDYIDIRPRVSKYDLSSTKSPFEFDQRNFRGQGQSSTYTLAPAENIEVCYKYYVGRIDKVVLLPNGEFGVIEGEPSTDPKEPVEPDDSLLIATVNLPPYIFDINSIEVDVETQKSYTMQDIASLEKRIERLEEFVVLNTLETKTENLKLVDSETGLERFKSGFFVDTFSNTNLHDEDDPNYKIAIDDEQNILRPTHYTTFIDMQLGSEVIAGVGATFEQSADHDFVKDLGSNGVKKTGDLITLNYENVEYFEQPYATRTESVTPFLVKYWTGSIELRPSTDSWIEEREEVTRSFATNVENLPRLPDINVVRVNNVTRNRTVFRNRVVTQTGIWRRRWIWARGSWWRRGNWRKARFRRRRSDWWRRFDRKTRWLSSSIRSVNGRQVVRFRAIRGRLTSADINWLRRVLPNDVANGFISQTQSSGRNRAIFLEFAPGSTRDRVRTTRNVSTTVRTSSNTVTTTIPPEITVNTTVEESESSFTEPTRFLRSRNIEFDVKGLRPRTRFYPFFEGIDVKDYVIPKLLEIEMVSGKFEIGETVESDPQFTSKKIRFRLCKPNHKTGPFANPEETFNSIPYRQSDPPEVYTEGSDYLNVDTRSLQLTSEVNFYGEIAVNMRVIGKTSGAIARINNSRLVSDNSGRLIGSLFIPDSKVTGNPKWINGENTFTVIDTPSLSEAASGDDNVVSESSAEEEFTSSSTTNVTVRNILTTRNIRIRPARNVNTTTITNTSTNTTAITNTRIRRRTRRIVRRWEVRDPLAQSFFVKDETGIFLTGVDVYFETKDESGIPVTLQLRTMENGVPTTTVFPFSEVTLTPDQINLSVDSSIPTRFTFASPVYLSGPQGQEVRGAPIASDTTAEYAVVLLSNSSNYRVFISRLGENDILTNIKIGSQPTLGSLFKSQNGSTWTPTQLEDLKYKLYRADFVDSGTVKYYNPVLALKNEKVTVLGPNQITILDKRSVIKLKDDAQINADVKPGSKIIQTNLGEANLVAIGGSITTGLGVTISNVGTGYTDGTFTLDSEGGDGIPLITVGGTGKGAKAYITVTGGSISNVNIIEGGYGYVEGDTLALPEIGQNVGFGGQVVVDSISSQNTLILDQINKSKTGNNAKFLPNQVLFYTNTSGITTYVGFSSETGVPVESELVNDDEVFDGLHFKIDAVNHGNHSTQSKVRISNVRPEDDQYNTKLTADLLNTETSTIKVEDTTGFETFEGLPVSGDNVGYIIIGDEVVGYTTYTSNSLGSGTPTIQRAVLGESQTYASGTPIYKYELNGVSLRRINKVHDLSTIDTNNHPITFNSFYVPIDSSDEDFEGNPIGKNRNSVAGLVFEKGESLGDSGAIVSTNINFNILTPNFATITPSSTKINAQVRTFSGSSINGTESAFEDQGYEEMTLDDPIQFKSTRIVASKVNEDRNVEDSPGNRSLTMEFNLSTEDSRVSPVIDDVTTGAILTSNIINAPAGVGENSTFADVEYIRGGDDLHEAIYISKPISLKLPSNSLKVFLKSLRTENNDIRVLYKLFRPDSGEESNFEPFPGYLNYKADSSGVKRVIDASKNDGSSDNKVSISSSSNFIEYEYTVDNLPEFTGFAIKIIFASTNQSEPPLVKDLRAIATVKPSI